MGNQSRPPNLLFVFADQMRGMDMGCAGNGDLQTPNMDRLAGQGVLVTDCIASVPVCGPNRACLLTGCYPTTHRVLANDLPLPTGLETLGSLAKANGYQTGYIGKWHLDGVPRSKFTPPGPRRFGFDYWAVYNCSHDYFHPKYYRDSPELVEVTGYEPEVQTDLALAFLERSAAGDEPFCLVVSWGPPHDPYDAVPERYRRRYDPKALTLRPNVRWETENPVAAKLDCRRTHADYYAAITALDAQLGRLLDRLDALELAEDTVVVFTSDHGDMLWSHGWMKKQAPFEEAVRVPFLLRWPGRLGGPQVREMLLGTVDILPTMAGLLGWSAPRHADGTDRSDALLGEPDAAPGAVFIANQLSCDEGARQGMPEWRGLRSRRHTYVETVGREPWLLFDNRADPFQLRNLVFEPGATAVLAELRARLSAHLAASGDPFLCGARMLDAFGLREAWDERQRSRDG